MIEEIVFECMVPILGARHELESRFHADDDWLIEVTGDDVVLSRKARDGHWPAVAPFRLHGYKYALRERDEPKAEPEPKKRRGA